MLLLPRWVPAAAGGCGGSGGGGRVRVGGERVGRGNSRGGWSRHGWSTGLAALGGQQTSVRGAHILWPGSMHAALLILGCHKGLWVLCPDAWLAAAASVAMTDMLPLLSWCVTKAGVAKSSRGCAAEAAAHHPWALQHSYSRLSWLPLCCTICPPLLLPSYALHRLRTLCCNLTAQLHFQQRRLLRMLWRVL